MARYQFYPEHPTHKHGIVARYNGKTVCHQFETEADALALLPDYDNAETGKGSPPTPKSRFVAAPRQSTEDIIEARVTAAVAKAMAEKPAR